MQTAQDVVMKVADLCAKIYAASVDGAAAYGSVNSQGQMVLENSFRTVPGSVQALVSLVSSKWKRPINNSAFFNEASEVIRTKFQEIFQDSAADSPAGDEYAAWSPVVVQTRANNYCIDMPSSMAKALYEGTDFSYTNKHTLLSPSLCLYAYTNNSA